MVEDNPGLLQLRILQQLAASSGNTVMVGWPGSEGAVGQAGAVPGTAARARTGRRRAVED
jgi:hypothetical protein